MKIFPYIEVHNAIPSYHPQLGGWAFPRYSEEIRTSLNPTARIVSGNPVGVELRFVIDGPEFSITLKNLGETASITIRRGSFHVQAETLEPGQTRRILIRKSDRLSGVKEESLQLGGWSPEVWRIQLNGGDILFQGMDSFGYNVRKPFGTEKPDTRWLAYGSSITQADHAGYPLVAAPLLRADVFNKGLSGSCHLESSIADWFGQLEVDLVTYELGINMRQEFAPEAFKQRASYLLDRTLGNSAPKAIVLITHFLNREHASSNPESPLRQRQLAFDRILRSLAEEASDRRVHLIEGTQLLTSFNLLAEDLVHPTHEGHAEIAFHLALKLKAILASASL